MLVIMAYADQTISSFLLSNDYFTQAEPELGFVLEGVK